MHAFTRANGNRRDSASLQKFRVNPAGDGICIRMQHKTSGEPSIAHLHRFRRGRPQRLLGKRRRLVRPLHERQLRIRQQILKRHAFAQRKRMSAAYEHVRHRLEQLEEFQLVSLKQTPHCALVRTRQIHHAHVAFAIRHIFDDLLRLRLVQHQVVATRIHLLHHVQKRALHKREMVRRHGEANTLGLIAPVAPLQVVHLLHHAPRTTQKL